MSNDTDAATAKPPSTALDRLEAAEQKRAQGNDKFKAGDIPGAKAEYVEALKLLSRNAQHGATGQAKDSSRDEDLSIRESVCRIPTQLNLALCHLRTEPPEAFRALELCEEVLDAEPDNPKATYRKAKALLELGELKEAEFEFVRACKLSPKDAAVRKDLESLRQRLRDMKATEKKTYEGLFERGPGFASENRTAAPAGGFSSSESKAYEFLRAPSENPYFESAKAAEEASQLQSSGKMEEAISAWEAAIQQASAKSDWPAYFAYWLELAQLYMDANVDLLGLRCLRRFPADGSADAEDGPPAVLRQHALLLCAICLLNEAETDAKMEVEECLKLWLHSVCPEIATSTNDETLENRFERYQLEVATGGDADAAIAQGVLKLVSGRSGVLEAFVQALGAPTCESRWFGSPRRAAQRWNMLGAVLANRGRHEQALEVYARALKLHPHYPRALNNQGIALHARNDIPGSVASYVAALDVVPAWAAAGIWIELKKTAEQQSEIDGLSEAVQQQSIAKLHDLLSPYKSTRVGVVVKDEPAEDLLARITTLGS